MRLAQIAFASSVITRQGLLDYRCSDDPAVDCEPRRSQTRRGVLGMARSHQTGGPFLSGSGLFVEINTRNRLSSA